ncbi:MAG: leucine-rich repeat protein, partial [Bacteroidales bacterium]|nr:leucine-rich repeat protein [Bacteroidales bacterium]
TGNLVIPDSVHYQGVAYPVVGIYPYTFLQCDGLTSVTLPGTLKGIGEMAFYGCDSLSSVTVPGSVTFTGFESSTYYVSAGIEQETFYNCPQLSGNFTIPNGVTYIGEYAFYYTAVTSVTFPSSLTSIDRYAFYNSAIESLDLPSSLRVIGHLAFGYCTNLQGIINLPDSLTAIVGGAFYRCYKVLSINIPDSAHIYSYENSPEYDSLPFAYVNNINWNRNLDVEALNSIGLSVFGAKTFNGHIENGLVYRDASKTEVTGCDYSQTNFSLPTSVDSIGNVAFMGHSSLNQIALSEGLEKIGESAFSRCSGLTDITLPATLEEIGKSAFSSCSGLTDITLPASLEKIGMEAFYSCSGLTDITLPASLTSLEFEAFARCESLDTLRMLGSVPPAYINSYLYLGNNGEDSIWLYDSSLVDVPIVVPCHAGSAYRNAAGWSICNNIIDPCGDEVETYTVTVSSADPTMGSVTVNGEAMVTVEEGEAVTLAATANEGYHFLHWNDGNTDAERTIVVTSDTTFIAYFEADGGTEGISEVDGLNAKVYSVNGQVVVETADDLTVTLYDVSGRIVATRQSHIQTITFDVPSTGTYLVKVGNAPARRVMVVK